MEDYILEGNISVKAAIQAGKRRIHKIYVDEKKKDKDTSYILREARKQHIDIEAHKREEIDKIAQGKTHGGLIAFCGERSYQTLQECIHKDQTFLCILEGIEDPFNFGHVLRSLHAAGCDGVIIPPRNWTTAAGVVAKSSAGASEYLSLIIVEDMESLLQEMKNQEITLIAAQRKDAISLYDYTFPQRVCIAIGGEMRGLSKVVEHACDQNLYIPYAKDFKNAMTASSSATIFAFEFLRQQLKK